MRPAVTRRVARSFVALLSALACASATCAAARADFTVAPSVIDVRRPAGAASTGSIDVVLRGERRARFEVVVEDVVQLPDGAFAFRPAGATARSPAGWVAVSPRSFSGAANRTQPVEYRLRIPRDAEPGDHAVSLTVKRYTERRPGEPVGAVLALSSRLTVRVPGRVREAASVSLDAPGMVSRAPVRAMLRVRNTGNVRLDFNRRNRGALAFHSGGKTRSRLALGGILLPRQTRELEVAWQDVPLAGRFEARAGLRVAGRDVRRTAEVWSVPWRQLAAVVLVALALAALAGGRRRRHSGGAGSPPAADPARDARP